MVKRSFPTQNVKTSRPILWSNSDLSANPILHNNTLKYPDAFKPEFVDIALLSRGDGAGGLVPAGDERPNGLARRQPHPSPPVVEPRWDADRHGLPPHAQPLPSPLPKHEFVTQWDCYDTPSSPLSGMLMHFHDHLAYLCETFHIMSTSSPPRQGSTDSGDPSSTSSYGVGSYMARYRRSRFYRTGSFPMDCESSYRLRRLRLIDIF
jgi:hypothetical protein